MTYNGTWLLGPAPPGTPPVRSTCTWHRFPSSTAHREARPILAWAGFALPAKAAASRDSVYAFLEYASRPEVDRRSSRASRSTRRSPDRMSEIHNAVAREFLPMLEDAITSLNWLWEPEIDAEIGNQVQALVKGDTDPASAGEAIQAVAEGLRASGRSYYRDAMPAAMTTPASAESAARDQVLCPRPRRNAGLVPRLSERDSSRGDRGKLTLISAPAGFGKSTLLAEWLAAARRRPSVALALARPERQRAGAVLDVLRSGAADRGARTSATTRWRCSSRPTAPVEAVLAPLLNELSATPSERRPGARRLPRDRGPDIQRGHGVPAGASAATGAPGDRHPGRSGPAAGPTARARRAGRDPRRGPALHRRTRRRPTSTASMGLGLTAGTSPRWRRGPRAGSPRSSWRRCRCRAGRHRRLHRGVRGRRPLHRRLPRRRGPAAPDRTRPERSCCRPRSSAA